MKIPKIAKIIILIILLLPLTGCNTNYQSLNDMAIVSSLLIDKKEDNYTIYLELYKEEKSENKSKKDSYFVEGSGKNIEQAIDNASSSISKSLYFAHINAVIFSTESAKTDLKKIFNYLEGKVQVNSNFYILMSDNIKELKKGKNEDNPIIGEKIRSLIKYSRNSGTMIDYDYLSKLKNYVSPKIDIFLNKIELKDDNLRIKDGYYFSKDKLVGELNNEEIKLINLFNDFKNLYLTFEYNNKDYTLKIDNCKIDYEIKDSININLKIKSSIQYAESSIALKDTNIIKNLNAHSGASLERRLKELLTKLSNDKSDIIGINNYIYKIYGKQLLDFYNNQTNIKVEVVINKKGLINTTLGGTNEK